MRLLLLILPAIAVLLSACSQSESLDSVPRDAALVKALQGNWCVSNDDGESCWGYETFLSDNTIQACGVIPETKKNFRAVASFKVSGHKTCYEVTESNDPASFPVGLWFCTQVLAIDTKSQRYKHLDTGETLTTYRVPAASVRCPTSDA